MMDIIYIVQQKKNGKQKNGRWKDIPLKHELKSYVYYSKEYQNGNKILTLNYSLDNYVVAYYYDKVQSTYESKAGYLEVIPSTDIARTNFLANLNDETARRYYENAWSFTEWYNEVLNNINYEDKNKLAINADNSALPGATSKFNDEKHEVIKESITSNLIPAMNIYDFEMPRLTDNDWDLVLNNVCFIAFLQNMPAGTTTYNNYTIAVSTENKETVNENDIYFVNIENGGVIGSYHRIWCDKLDANDANKSIRGYNKTEFKNNESLKHVPACYHCMVRASNPTLEHAEEFAKTQVMTYGIDRRRSAYYTALANEKSRLIKLSDFVNGSKMIEE